jgi:glycosyltransferase involved in cell wall biosynthesis
MKFSVLLPTRNRLEYLRYAVETVRRQDFEHWEIVVADNASEDDIAGFVAGLDDKRIRYVRSEEFLPVTDNWNRALERSSGEFVIMLGDDDGLMKGYFSRALALIAEHGRPDLIYSSGYLYAYPGVFPDYPDGLLHHYRNATFLQAAGGPFWLPREQALRLVRDSLDFKMKFTYNMQYSLIGRPLIDEMLEDGPFFQSAFPDYYATNVMFLKAKRILIDPEPTVAVGITPKSYGFYLFNNRESEGMEFLHSPDTRLAVTPKGHQVLPGTNMNNSWLLAMEAVAANYGLRLDYARYRRLQIVHVLRAKVNGQIGDEVYRRLWREIGLPARAFYGTALALVTVSLWALRGRPRAWFRRSVRNLGRWVRASNEWVPPTDAQSFRNMLEVYEGVARAESAASSH